MTPSRSARRRVSPGALAVALLALALPAQTTTPDPVRHLVQVHVRDAATIDRLVPLELDLASCTGLELPATLVEVIATDADIARLTAAGIDFDVAIRDLQSHYVRQLAAWQGGVIDGPTPGIGQGSMGGHYTLAEMESILDDLHQRFPALCAARTSIGRSVQGRDLWLVKISDNVGTDENEPEVWYDSVHHAREPVGMTATLQFMTELLEGYGTDPEATFLIDERELWFVPCVNPDGYEYNRSIAPGGGGMWRKNRRNNGGSFGVDLNRNYTTGWNAPNGGNSTNPSSDLYRGPAPFSEPESAAIEAFVTGRGITQVCSCHTYTEVLLRPWGYQNGDPANVAEYRRVGERATATSGMPHGNAAGLLYIAAGTTIDHHHVAHGALSWTPELGRSSEGGFWPAPPQQIAISQRHQRMFREFALTGGALLEFDDVTVTEAPGGDGDGRVEPGESGLVTVRLRNDGAASAAGSLALATPQVGVTVAAGSASTPAVPRFGSASTTSPLRFDVAPGFTGLGIRLELTLSGDGRTRTETIDLVDLRTLVTVDMEVDRGFARATNGTATTGLWSRGLPQQTTWNGRAIQPGGQHTPGGSACWVTDPVAGTSVGNRDVDSGYTDLVSPVVDLAHVVAPELRFWLWYSDNEGNDLFEVAASNDAGANWTTLDRIDDTGSRWVEVRVPVSLPATNRMRFRFRAQDLDASLVEACVDDLTIAGGVRDAALTLVGSGSRGTTLRLGVADVAGARVTLLLAPFRLGTPRSIPGIDGELLLDPALVLALDGGVADASGRAELDVPVPSDPSLIGVSAHWQALTTAAGSTRFGNATTVTLR